jgi:hypothetical protein
MNHFPFDSSQVNWLVQCLYDAVITELKQRNASKLVLIPTE